MEGRKTPFGSSWCLIRDTVCRFLQEIRGKVEAQSPNPWSFSHKGGVAEIDPHEMVRPFKNTLHHQQPLTLADVLRFCRRSDTSSSAVVTSPVWPVGFLWSCDFTWNCKTILKRAKTQHCQAQISLKSVKVTSANSTGNGNHGIRLL